MELWLIILLAFLFLFLFPTMILSSIIYTKLLIRTTKKKWGRECSIPEDEEYRYEMRDGKPKDKLNALRRELYAENREKILEQKASAYEKRKELNSSAAEEADV